MKKRILPLLLTLSLTASLLPAAWAAPAPSVEEMAQVLAALDIMTGDENGDLMLSRNVKRSEFTKLTIAASPLGDSVGSSTSVSPYPDVPYTHWAAPYVEAAVAAGYVNGYLDGTFHPDENITLAMGVTMAVRLLGYQDSDFSGAWPSGQMTLYRNLDLDEGISLGQNDNMTRLDAMRLFYNLLTAKTKTGQTYLLTLGHTLTPAGEIDLVALVNSAMEGPVVQETGWQSKVNFDVSTAKVYRAGKASSLAALQAGDVIYWSKPMRTLWAYTGKVTGLYQAVSPAASTPSAVTVAGKTYPIETAAAAYALSNLGEFKVGDTVTLLLGRDGGVAAVTRGSALNGTVYGVVSAVMDAPYTDSDGHSYTAKTVTVTATDGNSYSYPVEGKSSWEAGDLVKVAAAGSTAQLSKPESTSLSGKVNSSATQIGSVKLADDVEILDVDTDTGAAVKIYPDRLAGMTLSSSDVKFARKNSAGEVDALILADVTGDLWSYGVLTDVTETDSSYAGMWTLYGTYQYTVNGTPYFYTYQNGIFNLKPGPVKIEGSLQAPAKMEALKSVKLTSADAQNALTAQGETFPVWSGVTVYLQEDGDYRLTSLERVNVGYTLTGWYDRDAASGGRIRIITARAQ